MSLAHEQGRQTEGQAHFQASFRFVLYDEVIQHIADVRRDGPGEQKTLVTGQVGDLAGLVQVLDSGVFEVGFEVVQVVGPE